MFVLHCTEMTETSVYLERRQTTAARFEKCSAVMCFLLNAMKQAEILAWSFKKTETERMSALFVHTFLTLCFVVFICRKHQEDR